MHTAQKHTPSSMIFRIEQLLPSSTTTTTPTASTLTSTTMRGRSLSRPGVYTAEYSPKDTCSSSVPTSALLNSTDQFRSIHDQTRSDSDQTRAHCQLSSSTGELIISASLLRQIKLSEDIYSFNSVFELNGGQVRLRLVRDVAREDEIVAWFGEELILLMGIPFLTPLNIQGNDRYTCHLCHLTFETPHPLKIHLALGCGRSAMDILWMRLHYALKAATRTETSLSQLSPKPAASSTSSASPTLSPPSPTRLSAFRPLPNLTTSFTSPSAALSYPMASISTPLNAAAQIEAIVSNMGASKQGHLCIYCGKVYSRKYGLKIHIRTHTGFKPLKCKFCLRPFGDPSNLNKHVRLHMQTQPSSAGEGGGQGHNSDVDVEGEAESSYQCRLCHKSFVRRRDLQRHMDTRHRHGDLSIPTATTSTITLGTATQTSKST